MPSSPASSSASSGCRIDWRPSRWLAVALIALGAMAAAALLLSALPPALRLPSALLALMQGLRLARIEALRPAWVLAWPGGDAPAQIQGQRGGVVVLLKVRVMFRGPMATLTARDESGVRRRLVWWPDTLPPSARRQLRLVAVVSHRSDKPPLQLSA